MHARTPSILALLVAASPGLGRAADRLGPHVSVLGVALEDATMQEAQLLLGPAELRRDGGDAAAGAWRQCYAGGDGTTLSFVSNAELGGGTRITELQLVAPGAELDFGDADTGYVVPPELRPRCARLRTLTRGAGTEGGLRLGMTEEEVLRLVGVPSDAGDDHLEFMSEQELRAEQDVEAVLTRYRTLRVELSDGKVTAIRAWQVTVG